MHTLAQLKSGELGPVTRLKLSENLTEFPEEIFSLADSLQILDLSNNQLTTLPEDLNRLHQLKSLFLNNNLFESVPQSLASCPKLDLISFKSNRVKHFPENAVPNDTRWLILTDNQLTHLPNSIGNLHRLQKLMLAGNQLQALPESLSQCQSLQLMRISANQLSNLPDWLLELPKLAWLAFAGNPFCSNASGESCTTPKINLKDIQLSEQLGEGASGVIHRAELLKDNLNPALSASQVAVKLFKGDVTSDGYPNEELHASLSISEHPNLVKVMAHIAEDEQSGLIMELIPDHFFNLGGPPSLETCTRDTFAEGFQLTLSQIHRIAISMADTLNHLHRHKITHGDVYAHNILIDKQANVLFGDFGASSSFAPLPAEQQAKLKQIEWRAYGHLLDDLLNLCSNQSDDPELFTRLKQLKETCTQEDAFASNDFADLLQALQLPSTP
ncbi:leucine-rich repeat-containing protein kinase family protein [Thiomicrorhabdus sp. ZW0627]|uniref:leucine-rich repeat-containing protein kinase family protein n=1 Tax=Thiomicrorhabdus sp. ZW0627 TaxID=3039774 RepID=UPI0024364F55|nr:leucine-rich repeat-containing protein kinase family protein [Thiomicrorhabdus sp. ZW0627]MDG6773913.1 leucine-rich repeat-containing protein kinase family protein [Thiomicrorhabdus sp. ZW0627]